MACLCGIPQGAAGPERGVDMPNLITLSAAMTWLELLTPSTNIGHNARPRSMTNLRIIVSPFMWVSYPPDAPCSTTPQTLPLPGKATVRQGHLLAGHYRKHPYGCQYQSCEA